MPLGGLSPLPLPLGGDPVTGWTSKQHARVANDLGALVRTVPLCVIRANTNSTTVQAAISQWGVGLAYAPNVTINLLGDVTVTWTQGGAAIDTEDDYGNTYPIAIRWAHATVCETTYTAPAAIISAQITAANAVRVRTVDDGGTLVARTFALAIY